MSDFETKKDKDGFTCKLWRGERMTLLGFDVAEPSRTSLDLPLNTKGPPTGTFSPSAIVSPSATTILPW